MVSSSLGVDIKLIDGTPHWSERGADSFSPFKSNSFKAVGVLIGCNDGNYNAKSIVDDNDITYEMSYSGYIKFIFKKKMTVNLKSIGVNIGANISLNGSIDINGSNIISGVNFGNMSINKQHTFNAGDYIRIVTASVNQNSAGFVCLVIY